MILCIRSSVFRKMFCGKMAMKGSEIRLQDIEPDAFLCFLKYLYTDEVKIRSNSAVYFFLHELHCTHTENGDMWWNIHPELWNTSWSTCMRVTVPLVPVAALRIHQQKQRPGKRKQRRWNKRKGVKATAFRSDSQDSCMRQTDDSAPHKQSNGIFDGPATGRK